MKLVTHFNDFLNDTVNLNATRIQQLEDSIIAVKKAIRASEWEPKIKRFAAQGSWAHKTIIKPVDGAPFDADLIVFVDALGDWTPKLYIDRLYDQLRDHGTYKDKVRRYSHCVTIEYVGERKIDIAPCVEGRLYSGSYEVCNRISENFELSAPDQYTDWLVTRNSWSGSNSFRKVTKLLKYLRDIKRTFSCQSIVLTTLLGQQIYASDMQGKSFSDAPSALKTLLGRLDNWLQAHSSVPRIVNPVLQTETLNAGWDDTKYANFREKIHTYRCWVDDAYDEADRDESIAKWQRIFGDEFAKAVLLEDAASVTPRAVAALQSQGISASYLSGDLVSVVGRLGKRALPATFARLPWMQKPIWPQLGQPLFKVVVAATLHPYEDGPVEQAVADLQQLRKGYWLRFKASQANGLPLPSGYNTFWRVTNTDREAAQAQCLRGDYYPSTRGNTRFERLEYRGVHLVEAFVLRKRDNVLVSWSEAFHVVIV